MIQFLKTRNRTLLELWTGIIFLGIICEIVGAVLLLTVIDGSLLIYSLSLLTGIVMSLISTIHMYKSLDSALDCDEGTAKKKIYASYMLRYFVLVVLFAVICITGVLNPLVAFLGYMMLKVGALIQPWTHKAYNRVFHETDPIPMTQEEYDAMREAEAEENGTGEENDSEAEENMTDEESSHKADDSEQTEQDSEALTVRSLE